MKTIETKIAKNGVTIYYAGGKRVSRAKAIEAATENRDGKTFIIEAESRMNIYGISIKSETTIYTSHDEVSTFYARIDSYHEQYTVKVECHSVFTTRDSDLAKKVLREIEDAFFAGVDGCKILLNGTVTIITKDFDASDYAVTNEAMEVATNAEIALANGTGTFSEVKQLCTDMLNHNFGSYVNADMHATCRLIINLINSLEDNELDGFYWAGYKFQDAYESAWAHVMSNLNDTLQYKGVDDEAQISAVWTHDLNSCKFNRRGLAHFINKVLNSDYARHIACYLKYYAKDAGTIADYIIPITNDNTATDADLLQKLDTSDYAVSNEDKENATMKTTDIEKFLAAKQEISYDTNNAGSKLWKKNIHRENGNIVTPSAYWFKTTKDNAAKILANYGLTIDSYLAAKKAWCDRELKKACEQMQIDEQARFIREKIFGESKPLDDNSVWQLIPSVDELNDVVTDNTAQETTTAESAPADDFNAKLAELKAKLDAAKKIYDEKELVHQEAKRAAQQAYNVYDDARLAIKKIYRQQRNSLKAKLEAVDDGKKIRKDCLEEAPDAVQLATDYQKTLDTVKVQIDADNFDYRAAKEHIENVYEDIKNCIEYWSQQYGLTQEQSEKIYIALHINAYFDDIDYQLRDKLVAEAERKNICDSLERAMTTALKKYQGFCRVKNLSAANREMACYRICRMAFKEVIHYDRA